MYTYIDRYGQHENNIEENKHNIRKQICEYRPKKPSENVCRLLFPIFNPERFFPKKDRGSRFLPEGGKQNSHKLD